MYKLLILLIMFTTNIYAFNGQHYNSNSVISHLHASAIELPEESNSIWPYTPLSIGNSMQSFQNYGFSPGSAYWHDGLDIRGNDNENVYATVSGKIVNIENYRPGDKLYWEVAILDDNGLVWKYHHVDQKSIPRKIQNAFKNGTRIEQGELIGKIVTWPVTTEGERYHHIHLLVVNGLGQYVNPLALMPSLADTSKPVISKIGLTIRGKVSSKNSVRGAHGIYAEISDTILHDKFLLTPYKISYKLDKGDEKTVWKFDVLPGLTNDIDFIHDFFLKGTCGNYKCRKFLININFNKTANGNMSVFNLSSGRHEIEILAEDIVGNKTSKVFSYNIL